MPSGTVVASLWLDLVRYADTVGYHGDQDHNASPYRDYVIDAWNANMPFDQFTREQLAGDLLPQASLDQQIASAYNRLLQTSHEGGVQPREYLAIYVADRVRNFSAVWLGGTLGCAQCHDHKQRGMLDETLIVWGGEFGRTPMFQGKGGPGRDHHIKGFSMWLAGGGIRSGIPFGETDELGYHAVENVVHVRDLHATMLHLLGIDHTRLTVGFQGLDVRLTGVEPARVIQELW